MHGGREAGEEETLLLSAILDNISIVIYAIPKNKTRSMTPTNFIRPPSPTWYSLKLIRTPEL